MEKKKEELLPGKIMSLSQSLRDYLSRGSEWITVAHAWVAESAAWAVIGSIGAPLISWFWLQHLSDPRWVCSTKVFTLHWRMSQISQWIPAEKQQTQIWRMQSPGRALNPYFMSLIPRYLELEEKGLLEQIQMLLLLFTTSEKKEEKKIDDASVERNLRTKSH